MRFYLANYTAWSTRAKDYVNSDALGEVELHLGTETHLSDARLRTQRRTMGKAGWRVVAAPAQNTEKGGPKGHGGAWILARKHLHSIVDTPVVDTEGGGSYAGEQWTALRLRRRGRDVIFVVAYFDDSIGLQGVNVERLQRIAAYLKAQQCLFVIGAD